MHTEGLRHPQTLVSLTIVRTRAEFLPNSRIRSVAMFSVSHSSNGPVFALDHHAYSHRALRANIISDISNRLPRDAALITEVPLLPRGYFRRLMITGDPFPPADIQLIQRARPDLQVIGVEIGRQGLQAAADELAIPLADAAAPVIQRARRAADHAQAVWATYVREFCMRLDRINLVSAWQAWRAIERARPLPF